MRPIVFLALLVVGYLLYKLYFEKLLKQGTPGKIKIALIGLGLVFLGLAVSGRAPAVFAILGAAMTQVMRFAPLLVRFAPSLAKYFGGAALGGLGSQGFGGSGSSGQESRVRTDTLVMTLNHDSGHIDGEILTGQFAGRFLNELTIDEIKQLYQQCQGNDAEAVRLLQAYVARQRSEEWNDAPNDQSGSQSGNEQVTVREAYDILSLKQGATRAEITRAHRSLMSKMHPDKGGSNYLAMKINAAKKVLLDHVKE